jgi:type IX secretion system PorP/SprF family membrane protein
MRVLKKYILIIAIAFGTANSYAQQTVQFSQYMFNGLAVNPAYAGYKEDLTVNLSSRLQWVGIDGAPKTSTISVDGVTNLDTKNVGIGLLATNDRLGPQNTSSVYANYAYRLRLNEDDSQRLSFGIAAGVVQYQVDGSKLIPTDVLDPTVATGTENKISPDFRVGVYYYSSTMYVGASVLNLLPEVGYTANTAIVKQTRHLYLTGGVLIPLSSSIDLKPSVMFKEDFRAPTSIDVTTYLLFSKKLWLGISYNTGVVIWNKSYQQTGLDKGNTAAGIAQVNLSDHFRFGYSYDFTTSKFTGYQGGSHEISLSMSFAGKRPRVLSPRYF